MNTDILFGIAIGGTGVAVAFIAFICFCLHWARASRPDPYEQPIGEGH